MRKYCGTTVKPDSDCDLLEDVQYEAAKIITGAIKGTSKYRLYTLFSRDLPSSYKTLYCIDSTPFL